MGEIFAHEWGSVGEERIPRWPSKIGEKRRIEVEIFSWKGNGGKHYVVKVDEQDNSWWNESENAWVHVSCDSSNRGYSMRAEVLTEKEAVEIAIFFVNLIGRKDHVVQWTGPKKPKWAKGSGW